MNEKLALRKSIRAALREKTSEEWQGASEEIRHHIESSDPWKDAGVIALFAAQAFEPALDPLLEKAVASGKKVAYPRISPEGISLARVTSTTDLQKSSRWELREPIAPHLDRVDLNEVDLLLVPGLAFDLRGGRLGRGGGFYDRLLSGARRPWLLGVCFDRQIVPFVPVEPHDQPVHGIVSERGLRKF